MIRRHAGLEHHEADRGFPPGIARYADHGSLDDALVLGKFHLEVDREDVEPARNDHVLGPSDQLDKAIGIDPAEQTLIFEKFRQSDASITRHHQGTGLGLTLAKELVEHMGGRIGLVSQPGVGSTFYIMLPSSDGKAQVTHDN